ncbi:MAG: hypothetical protein KF855_03240 [Acidobacteria bacterium]|nr:hypothetical protein [Acidobacteriota bacterium]
MNKLEKLQKELDEAYEASKVWQAAYVKALAKLERWKRLDEELCSAGFHDAFFEKGFDRSSPYWIEDNDNTSDGYPTLLEAWQAFKEKRNG